MLPVLLPVPPADWRSGAHSVYTHHPEHRSHPEQALLLTRTATARSPYRTPPPCMPFKLLPVPPGGFPSRAHSVYTHLPKHRSHPGDSLPLTRSVLARSLIPYTTSLHAFQAAPCSSGRLSVPSTLCLFSPSQTQITPGRLTSAHPLRTSKEPHTRHHLPACSPCCSLFLRLTGGREHTLSILTIPNTDHTRSRHFCSPAP